MDIFEKYLLESQGLSECKGGFGFELAVIVDMEEGV